MPANHANEVVVTADKVVDTTVLTAEGVLDSTTYQGLRDAIIKAALECPRAVIVDVTALSVPAPSAWAVFTSARWHVSQWPDVPIVLTCAHSAGRDTIVRNGISRYVPVYASTAEAVNALAQWPTDTVRQRARFPLDRSVENLSIARDLVNQQLTAWSRCEMIAVAKLIVTVFVENVLNHTDGIPSLRLECMGDRVTVAVDDECPAQATRRESSRRGADEVSGLAIVSALSRRWGNSPTPTGKTVWASIGPEDCL